MNRPDRLLKAGGALVACSLLSMCTQPYAVSVWEELQNAFYIELELAESGDLDELPSMLSEDIDEITLTGNVPDADSYQWQVNGDDPATTEVAHVTVTGDMDEDLTINRGHDAFTDSYSPGTKIYTTLVVRADDMTYSGGHSFVVE